MKKEKLLLILIILIASFLRLYSLMHVPPSASLDEATIGWNAYSILNTGRDEYGYQFPILLRAYDDFRPALYVYSVVPFVKLFGLNILSVRLPSAILSILTVLATYFLVLEMFKNQKIVNAKHLALLSSFLLAISPWHIYISRLGHEVNLGLSFFIFALLFFLKRRIYFATLFIALSFASYQSEKIFIPVMILGIFLIFKDELLKVKKKVLISGVLAVIILVPFTKTSLTPDALLRYKATNVFDASQNRFMQQSLLLKKVVEEKDIVGQLIYNRRILALEIAGEGYISHFNPVWLFTNSSNEKFKAPGLGLLYFWTIPFILIGIYILIAKRFDPKTKKLIFLWLLAAPLPAAITTENPHALRTLTFLPTWEFFASLGVVYLYSILKQKIGRIYIIIIGILILFSLGSFYEDYFKAFPQNQSSSFQYAIPKAVSYVLSNKDSYKKIIFGNRQNLYQSYMFFLFYSKYDPKRYQQEGGTKSGGYDVTHKFDKYEFRPINIGSESKGNLYIDNYSDLNPNGALIQEVKTLEVISNLDGEKAIKIVTK